MGKYEVAEFKNACVFLDRDGVINRPIVRGGRPYPPGRVEEVELYDYVWEGCQRLKTAGFLLVVVTNQPDVGRGTQSRAQADTINEKIAAALPQIDLFETCFHAGEEFGEPCTCRKPKPGMLFHAADLLKIDLPGSFLIGDRWQDIDCARAAGCRAIFIDHQYAEPLRQKPDVTVGTFSEAVAAVLSMEPRQSLRGVSTGV
ncbi:MAG TPA: HAD-IIIA family hydrolase [Candidatus Udaeobacter sp.]|nr:HAD-IIIA family hydrolase [Candidatus Udaeobacter sp.]